jgi:endonuclease YncB( thermonuclease family)
LVLPPRRRIFRSALFPIPRPQVLARIVACTIVAAGVIALYLRLPELISQAPAAVGELSANAPVRELTASAANVAVVDGETLRVGEKIVTLLGVAAPPRGQMCQRGDGSAFDCGAASAAALAALVRDRTVDCRLVGEDGSGRMQGICRAAGAELNQEQIARGWARPTGHGPVITGTLPLHHAP